MPQLSVAVNVLVCDLKQLVLCTALSVNVTIGLPHASVAVAVPSDAFTSAVLGLQVLNAGAVVKLSTGAVKSTVHVTVLTIADVLPQASVAVNVLV